VRFGFCGAAPLSAPTWKDFEEVFGFPIYQGYGLTETTCWAVSIPITGPRNYETVGIPLDCASIKIDTSDIGQMETFLFGKSLTDEDGNALVAKGPVSGEVLIRGPIVSPGYYKNPKLNKETMTKDEYFKTGDLGFFDNEGFLHITGRLKEIIIKNGANVFSKDIDRVLIKHEAVRECKTIGVPDELVGERIYSICVLNEGHSDAELAIKMWLQSQLSQPMWPDVVIAMGYLPSGAAGKISTNILKKIVTGTLCEEIITSLNRVRYKRAQPSDPGGMSKLVQKALKTGTPLSFLAYWGCGTRDNFSEFDKQTLDRLKEYVDGAKRVPQVPSELTIIFTDTHARNNKIPVERMTSYFAGIRNYAEKLGMKTILLSEIWKEYGLTSETILNEVATDAFKEKWENDSLRQRLIDQAAKHAEDNQKPEDAAMRYYCTTAHEGVIVAKKYPHSIFTSYNHPDFDIVSPVLPKVYLSSYKDGTAVKPWFID
ncbi:MAG: acyl--CoA ligase, partial [Chitinophagaceae bacterium]|nr:acyl--CoA ligase [Oligoflexus sp.]